MQRSTLLVTSPAVAVFMLFTCLIPDSEAKTMSDLTTEIPLTAQDLRGANYAATLALRGGETIYKGKQLGAYLVLARSVFEAALQGASRSESAEDREAYLTAAYMTAYNIASNTWPGWNEGDVDDEHRQVGYRFSKMHMEIVEQLDLPTGKSAAAFWIGAAHELAAANHEAARSMFDRARVLGEEANSEETRLMNQGWLFVIDILEGKKGAEEDLKKLQEKLTGLGDDGKFFAGQFDEALKVFR